MKVNNTITNRGRYVKVGNKLLCCDYMKLGSKKHLQNPKLPAAKGAAPVSGSRANGLINPKVFVPQKITSKNKKRK